MLVLHLEEIPIKIHADANEPLIARDQFSRIMIILRKHKNRKNKNNQ